tara:strand:+ start:81 stop:737 length:657 start_codon:yes stop_codon:yes gene_type:complete
MSETKNQDVDFAVEDVVVGSDIDAVRLAWQNKYFLFRNREPHHHSYEGAIEQEWSKKIYDLFNQGLCPFAKTPSLLRIDEDNKIIKVITEYNTFYVAFKTLFLLDDENVEGASLGRDVVGYRVVDWFDCQGLYDLSYDTIQTQDKFVKNIKLFKSRRIDGNQRYLDLLCESFLTDSQLKSFDYSDTMVRFKIIDLFKKRGIDNVRMSLWKRDIYPVYK